MELPENYGNWVEFAKECIKIQLRYPDAKSVKCFNNNKMDERLVSEYNINAVKAKAFDELIGKADFNFGHVMQLKDAALSRGTHFDALNSITDLLLSLTNDR